MTTRKQMEAQEAREAEEAERRYIAEATAYNESKRRKK